MNPEGTGGPRANWYYPYQEMGPAGTEPLRVRVSWSRIGTILRRERGLIEFEASRRRS